MADETKPKPADQQTEEDRMNRFVDTWPDDSAIVFPNDDPPTEEELQRARELLARLTKPRGADKD